MVLLNKNGSDMHEGTLLHESKKLKKYYKKVKKKTVKKKQNLKTKLINKQKEKKNPNEGNG